MEEIVAVRTFRSRLPVRRVRHMDRRGQEVQNNFLTDHTVLNTASKKYRYLGTGYIESTLISAFQSLERRDFFQGPVKIRSNSMNIGNQITKLASPCTGDISERNLFDF